MRRREQVRTRYATDDAVDTPIPHQCPGDGERGCLTRVNAFRLRCRFCTKTMKLREATRGR